MSSISALSCHRWTLPILAQLAASGGSRFVPLVSRLGLSRDTLRQTLDVLIEAGLVARNPGYGHPTRPEYVLTKKGQRIAPLCAQLLNAVKKHGIEDIVLRKWSLPVIAVLSTESRYGDLRRAVGATPRALTLTLKALVTRGLVERRVHEGFPPSTTYRLTPKSRAIRRHVAQLADAL